MSAILRIIKKLTQRNIFIALIFIYLFAFPSVLFAQNSNKPQEKQEQLEGVITAIKEEKSYEAAGKKQLYQKLELLVTDGAKKGKKIIIDSGNMPVINVLKYQIGDKVLVTGSKTFEGKDFYYITDYIRRDSLYLLFALFVAVTLLIGTKRGAASLIGMVFSFILIFAFILPQISAGHDPITIAIIASIAIIPVTFYLSHGLNKKTTAAIAGTFIALLITGVLANFFVDAARLTGFASEEAGFLESAKHGLINIKGLLLAGIIVSVLGILDDITVSQAAVVYQLKAASPKLSFAELYSRAMDIGKDHIASVVNTLVLVYTGAALPLLLLFIDNPTPFGQVINHEIIAVEIVRTLVASIGLIVAVPITTFLTAYVVQKNI